MIYVTQENVMFQKVKYTLCTVCITFFCPVLAASYCGMHLSMIWYGKYPDKTVQAGK
jgi:hypothetical protein